MYLVKLVCSHLLILSLRDLGQLIESCQARVSTVILFFPSSWLMFEVEDIINCIVFPLLSGFITLICSHLTVMI